MVANVREKGFSLGPVISTINSRGLLNDHFEKVLALGRNEPEYP